MKEYLSTFERFEYKYWVSDRIAQQFLRSAAPYLRHDDAAATGQRNTSLYLDSPALDFMRQHIESSPDRCKLRVRAYGDPPIGPAFFEVKRKVKGVTLKRRAVMPLAVVPELLRGELAPGLPYQSAEQQSTLEQFLYLMLTYKAEPKVLVTCRREAYVSTDPSEGVRLTMDRDICYQPARGPTLLGSPQGFTHLCGLGSYQAQASTLIELKFRNIAPFWVHELVQQYSLTVSAYSKYVMAMRLEELGAEAFFAADRVPAPLLPGGWEG